MTYNEFAAYCARFGFTQIETTETGFGELLAIGFTPDDIYSIECDLQAGFDQSDSIAAMIESMVDAINSHVESVVEYETSHIDAGNNYSHLPAESWHSDHENRLVDYCKEHGIDISGLDIDSISNDVLEWFHMESGHMWSNGNGGFLLDSYPLQEIEIQLESDIIGRQWHPKLIERLNRKCDCYLRYSDKETVFAYVNTDSVWDAIVSEKQLREIVETLRAMGKA